MKKISGYIRNECNYKELRNYRFKKLNKAKRVIKVVNSNKSKKQKKKEDDFTDACKRKLENIEDTDGEKAIYNKLEEINNDSTLKPLVSFYSDINEECKVIASVYKTFRKVEYWVIDNTVTIADIHGTPEFVRFVKLLDAGKLNDNFFQFRVTRIVFSAKNKDSAEKVIKYLQEKSMLGYIILL
jgi:hypothetical protein